MIHDLSKRLVYEQGALLETEAGDDPQALFHSWFRAATDAGVLEPSAMSLSTVSPSGMPSNRIVLLRGAADSIFTFFTNYDGRKGRELDANAQASLLFFWPQMERQIRVEGRAKRASRAESEAYFASRPRESQLGAWASMQSQPVRDRAELEDNMARVSARFASAVVPCPPHWGGYALAASAYEFWQGRPGRLHDRMHYARDERSGSGGGSWLRTRLSP